MQRELARVSDQRVALSVIVPVYNEAAMLATHMRELTRTLDTLPDAPVWELLLVDDGSNDGSLGLAMRLAIEDQRIAVCMHDRNYGNGRAMATGCAQARGDYIMVVDADLHLGPDQVTTLWTSALRSGADIVVASVFMRGGKAHNVPLLHKCLSAGANWFLSRAAGGRVSTLTCLVRLYRTSCLREMIAFVQPDAMLPDLILEAVQRGAHIIEVPATPALRPQRRRQSPFKQRSALRYALAILRCGLRRRSGADGARRPSPGACA